MKLFELKQKIQEYQYMEDTDIISVSMASVLATRLKLGDPVWMVVVGPSSGGKSQILRPIAQTDEKFIHRIDDLTENTLLSGGIVAGGKDVSLLNKVGPMGILVISDLTVIFSKSKDSQAAILGQIRMVYDGEMTKYVGNKPEPLKWKGSLGVLAGCTPSVYTHFETVADMGERFIFYRMKDNDAEKATRLSLGRAVYGKELDQKLSDLYAEYIKAVMADVDVDQIKFNPTIYERFIRISVLAEKIRTVAHVTWKDGTIDRIPVAAMPMRVALQLMSIAKGLAVMRYHETGSYELIEEDLRCIDWCAYSLANEEKRAILKILCSVEKGVFVKTQIIADKIGLDTSIVRVILQNMSATGVLERTGNTEGLMWKIKDDNDYYTIRRIEGVDNSVDISDRALSQEEAEESKLIIDKLFDEF